MAVSKIQTGYEVTTDYTEWFTPASGFTVSTCALRRLARGIYTVYISGQFSSNAMSANAECVIGTYDKNFFGGHAFTGYASANLKPIGSSLQYPGYVATMLSGNVAANNQSNTACGNVSAQGIFFIRYET